MICVQDKTTQTIWSGRRPRGLDSDTARRVLTKLEALDAASQVSDLQVPPGNRLKKLQGDRAGQWSVRVSRISRVMPRFVAH